MELKEIEAGAILDTIQAKRMRYMEKLMKEPNAIFMPPKDLMLIREYITGSTETLFGMKIFIDSNIEELFLYKIEPISNPLYDGFVFNKK